MSPPVRQHSFASGELTPAMYARTDLNRYENGLRTCRNMIVMRHGGVTGRPGTQYVGTTLNGANPVRLIPFIFNETGLGQSYILEFGNLYIAFYQNGGVVTSAGSPYTIVSPYAQADLETIQYAECADVITLVHPNYPVQELKRLGHTNWTITPLTYFSNGVGNYVSGITMSGTAGTPVPWNQYVISAVNANGEEGSLYAMGVSAAVAGALALASLTTPINLAWSAAANGASYYKIYRCTQVGVGAPPWSQGPLGYVGQTTATRFTDTGIAPDYTNAPPVSPSSLFQNAGDYPSTVGFAQQRRAFANTNNKPLGFWLSRSGDFNNFDVHITPVDSDAIISSISGEEVNAIQHIVEQKTMLLMTSGAEVYVQGNNAGGITPGAINAVMQSSYGSSPLKPLKVADIVLFNQALGSFIRDFAYDFSIDGYRGNDITIFSSHLFEGYSLVDWTFQKVPDSLVWAARSDGVLLSCTYVREQQILAWTRHDFTNGFVENVCAIPENGANAVYLVIRRVINGVTVRYLERMASRIWSDELTATYLDSWAQYDGRNAGATTMTLTASGGFQSAGTAYQQPLTLTASSAFFTSAMIGDQIVLSDSKFLGIGAAQDGEGATTNQGNQVRLTIQAYTSPTAVTVTPSGAVPLEFQNAATKQWARAVKTVSGLGYLEGQKVSVWADRFVVGSPLNSHVSQVYTVTGGTLTLDKPYSVIYVGLPMVQDVESLDLEAYFGETMLAKRKRVATVAVYIYNTRSFFAGSESPDSNLSNKNNDPLYQLYEEKAGGYQVTYDEPPPLLTEQDYIITSSRWNKNGRIFFRNCDPVPFSLLAISPRAEDSTPQSVYKRV